MYFNRSWALLWVCNKLRGKNSQLENSKCSHKLNYKASCTKSGSYQLISYKYRSNGFFWALLNHDISLWKQEIEIAYAFTASLRTQKASHCVKTLSRWMLQERLSLRTPLTFDLSECHGHFQSCGQTGITLSHVVSDQKIHSWREKLQTHAMLHCCPCSPSNSVWLQTNPRHKDAFFPPSLASLFQILFKSEVCICQHLEQTWWEASDEQANHMG